MARAADGTMTLSGTFAVANTIPVSGTINGYISDITTEVTDSLSRSGKGGMLTHLPMGGFKINNVADGAVVTDVPSLKQVQNGTVSWADGGGTVDAITATYSPAVAAVVEGMRLRVRATGANTVTTPTFAPNGLTARTIKKLNGVALAVGDIAGDEHDLDLTYVATGTYWNLNNPATAGSVSGIAVSATSLAASTTLALTGDITPAQITADQNDYAPTGHATASVFRLDTSATWSITGLAGGADGRIVEIQNIGSNAIILVNGSASSSAANRFALARAADLQIAAGGSIQLQYDATASLWRVCFPIALATQANMENANINSAYVSSAVQHYHPGHPKSWGCVTVSGGTPTLQTSYNMTSITDTATGRLTCTIATDHSSANYSCHVSVEQVTAGASGNERWVSLEPSLAAGSFIIQCINAAGTSLDPKSWHFMTLGDQA